MDPIPQYKDVAGPVAQVRNSVREERRLKRADQGVDRSLLTFRVVSGPVSFGILPNQRAESRSKRFQCPFCAFAAVFASEPNDLGQEHPIQRGEIGSFVHGIGEVLEVPPPGWWSDSLNGDLSQGRITMRQGGDAFVVAYVIMPLRSHMRGITS